jgi:class 3 adenylate cyclase
VLFCDVRDFSASSEKLGPEQTVRWIATVLSRLSDCVAQEQGVLVDHLGDALMAMWGAPEP